jgi:glycosyltransferase involved in cell wall biosynthesis
MTRVTILTPFNPIPDARTKNPAKHGGVERYAWRLAQELDAKGFHVTIVASDDETKVETHKSIEVRTVARLASPFGAAVFDWMRPVMQSRADLLHVQGAYPFVSDMAPLASRSLGIPSLLTYHFDAVGRSAAARWAAARFYGAFCHTISLYDRIIFLSRAYLESSPIFPGVPSEKVRLGGVGVDTEFFHPLQQANGQRSVLFVGRLAPFKGIDLLIDAVGLLPGWNLTIVGDGELRVHLQERLAREDLPIQWVQNVSDEELRRLYNAARVTVLPSTDRQECVGTVLMESLACGTAVVASDLPGLRYVADFGGLLFSVGDRRALADAIEHTGEREWTWEDRMAIADLAATRFSWPKIAQDVIAVYNEIL